VVVTCPKCKVRLKVDEAKLPPQGSRFKCPRCSAVLLVKKPVAPAKKTLDGRKIIVAHSRPEICDLTVSLLKGSGYDVTAAADGIDFMVRALKELPFLSVVEVALPKIYGFEACKRLKARSETKEMKFILVPSVYDKAKYRREPVSLYGADDYVEEHDLEARLIEKVNALRGVHTEVKIVESAGIASPAADSSVAQQQETPRVEPAVRETAAASAPAVSEEAVERAKRLARTIISDIYLYNSAKVDEAIRKNNFYAVFASEIREGQKLYDNRIPQEIRNIKDFYRETIDNFLAAREKTFV
jgi:predicted Zn finger-like uncharacterized protein